jgi:hypothetical protein
MSRSGGARRGLAAAVLVAGLVASMSGRAGAQWIFGPSYAGWGYPYGGWGWGYPYGAGWGWGVGYGMSLPLLNTYRMQAMALNASRYNLRNAEAATAYQAANLYHQQALNLMMDNYQRARLMALGDVAPGVKSYVRAGGEGAGPGRAAAVGTAPARGEGPATGGRTPATFQEMIARDGSVFWPLGAPTSGDLGAKQQAASRAIRDAMQDYRADGRVSVRRVADARRKLAAYAVPAANALRDEKDSKDVRGFSDYVQTLDAGLRSLAAGPETGGRAAGPAGVGEQNFRPNVAPETAGEVVKEKIEAGSRDRRKEDTPKRP